MRKLACFLLLIPMLIHADNRPAIQSLMDEPASLLDIGMLRLQDFIIWTKRFMAYEYSSASTTEIRHIDINAHYAPKDEIIRVTASLMDTRSTKVRCICHKHIRSPL